MWYEAIVPLVGIDTDKRTSWLPENSENSIGRLNAKVMIHTFAHILINELIFVLAMEVRLFGNGYIAHPWPIEMNAVLIYTAAGDTEGSMGVWYQGRQILPQLIESAIIRASWCSSDPVCIESTGQVLPEWTWQHVTLRCYQRLHVKWWIYNW